jgi:hypothetical protein
MKVVQPANKVEEVVTQPTVASNASNVPVTSVVDNVTSGIENEISLDDISKVIEEVQETQTQLTKEKLKTSVQTTDSTKHLSERALKLLKAKQKGKKIHGRK